VASARQLKGMLDDDDAVPNLASPSLAATPEKPAQAAPVAHVVNEPPKDHIVKEAAKLPNPDAKGDVASNPAVHDPLAFLKDKIASALDPMLVNANQRLVAASSGKTAPHADLVLIQGGVTASAEDHSSSQKDIPTNPAFVGRVAGFGLA